MGMKWAFGMTMVALIASACVSGHCRRKNEPPPAPQAVNATPAAPVAAKPANGDNVYVYKYDGSLQCGMGKPVALDAMVKELAGIPVVSSEKKRDGLMHIQVCGSITGMANVYEIPAKFQKQAEAKGFKRWSAE